MVLRSQPGKDHVLTYVQTKKAKEGEEQKTFFQKYVIDVNSSAMVYNRLCSVDVCDEQGRP